MDNPRHKARRDDPVSSKMAAETVVERGVTEAHRKLIYAYLRQCGVGMTSNELASVIGLRGDKIQKRMAELEREGLVIRGPVRSCRCGLPAHEWRVAPPPERVHRTPEQIDRDKELREKYQTTKPSLQDIQLDLF